MQQPIVKSSDQRCHRRSLSTNVELTTAASPKPFPELNADTDADAVIAEPSVTPERWLSVSLRAHISQEGDSYMRLNLSVTP